MESAIQIFHRYITNEIELTRCFMGTNRVIVRISRMAIKGNSEGCGM